MGDRDIRAAQTLQEGGHGSTVLKLDEMSPCSTTRMLVNVMEDDGDVRRLDFWRRHLCR